MKYPRPTGPRTVEKRKREAKPQVEPEHTIVMKEIHGELVAVKVYEPAWAQGERRQMEDLGLKPKNPFSRDRGEALKKKSERRGVNPTPKKADF